LLLNPIKSTKPIEIDIIHLIPYPRKKSKVSTSDASTQNFAGLGNTTGNLLFVILAIVVARLFSLVLTNAE
jgi:hypothetical protein